MFTAFSPNWHVMLKIYILNKHPLHLMTFLINSENIRKKNKILASEWGIYEMNGDYGLFTLFQSKQQILQFIGL